MGESERNPDASQDEVLAGTLLFEGARYHYIALAPSHPTPSSVLTNAERQVAELAVNGESAQSIADMRGTSVRTVENQLAKIYAKLAIASRSELCDVWHSGDVTRHTPHAFALQTVNRRLR